jgi:hypothetical protein
MNRQSKHFQSRRGSSTQTSRAGRSRLTELARLVGRVRELRGRFSLEVDRRPHGHVIGHAIGEPMPAMGDGLPRGHVVAAPGAYAQTFDGLPHGHVVAARKADMQTLDGLPHGHVIGRAIGRGGPMQTAEAPAALVGARDSSVMGIDDHGVARGVMGGGDPSRALDTMGNHDRGMRAA